MLLQISQETRHKVTGTQAEQTDCSKDLDVEFGRCQQLQMNSAGVTCGASMPGLEVVVAARDCRQEEKQAIQALQALQELLNILFENRMCF
jgi:hypothetical protein